MFSSCYFFDSLNRLLNRLRCLRHHCVGNHAHSTRRQWCDNLSAYDTLADDDARDELRRKVAWWQTIWSPLLWVAALGVTAMVGYALYWAGDWLLTHLQSKIASPAASRAFVTRCSG